MEIPWRVEKFIESRKLILTKDLTEFDKKINEYKKIINDLREEKNRTAKELNDLNEFKKEVEK